MTLFLRIQLHFASYNRKNTKNSMLLYSKYFGINRLDENNDIFFQIIKKLFFFDKFDFRKKLI